MTLNSTAPHAGIYNCQIFDVSGKMVRGISATTGPFYIANTVIRGFTYGLYMAGLTSNVYAHNCNFIMYRKAPWTATIDRLQVMNSICFDTTSFSIDTASLVTGSRNIAISQSSPAVIGGVNISSYSLRDLFVQTDSLDFRLKDSLPIINAGYDLSIDIYLPVTTDIRDSSRSNPPDIGAYERMGGSQLTPTAASITTHPQNVSTYDRYEAVFTVVADGTQLTYQWYENDVLIPGATSDTLRIVEFLRDNGNTYRCLVAANTGDPVYSNYATLTVSAISVDISSALIDDDSVIIAGINFYGKGQGDPFNLDDLEDGVCDINPTIGPQWSDKGALSISTDSLRHSGSSYNAHLDFDGSAGSGIGHFTGNNSYLSRKWYLHYWFMVDENWDWGTTTSTGTDKYLANIKFYRVWNPGSIAESFFMATQGWVGNVTAETSTNTVEQKWNFESNYPMLWSKGNWHLLQFEYVENVGKKAKDGIVRMWRDGRLVFSADTIQTRDNWSEYRRLYDIGFQNSWDWDEGIDDIEGAQAPNDFYMDDIYTDTTFARVEIGNRGIYDSCTHREIQLVRSWSPTGIVTDYMPGSFEVGDSQFVFVVDAFGNISEGYNLLETTTPTWTLQPTNDTITGNGQEVSFSATFSYAPDGEYVWRDAATDEVLSFGANPFTFNANVADTALRIYAIYFVGETPYSSDTVKIIYSPPVPIIDSILGPDSCKIGDTIIVAGTWESPRSWYIDDSLMTIIGSSGDTLDSVLVNPVPNGLKYLKCVDFNGLRDSIPITVYSESVLPVITVQPTDQTVDENHTATFTLTATGADSYQWKSKANGNVGTSSNTYAFTATLADNGDSLWCYACNENGCDTSDTVELTVNDTIIEPITITVQPQNMTFPYGAYTDTFVYMTSNAIHYNWNRNGEWLNTDNDTLTFEAHSGMDGWLVFGYAYTGNDTAWTDTITLTEANAPPIVTVDPVSDTTTSTVRMFAEWTGDSVQVAWYRFHNSDTTLMSRDSILQFTANSSMHGDSFAAVLYNDADTVMSAKAGVYFVYAVYDSVNTGDSNTIYVHGNFLSGTGWTATLSDSTLTTESGSATNQEFGYNHKILLKKKKYRLRITDGVYSILLYIGQGTRSGGTGVHTGVGVF